MRKIAVAMAGVLALGGCLAPSRFERQELEYPDAATESVLEVTRSEPGGAGYAVVFESVLDVFDDYFEIASANRYDGRIEGLAKVAPGVGMLWKTGSPDPYERLLATSQSIRHRAFVLIQPAPDNGFRIHVSVVKELEVLPQPVREITGGAAFRSDNTVERTQEVIDAGTPTGNWRPLGNDPVYERWILDRIRRRLDGF
jgi:hypothetical protein